MATDQQIAKGTRVALAVALAALMVLGGAAVGRVSAPVPKSCLTAIDLGDKALGYASDGFSLAIKMDLDGMGQVSSNLSAITEPYKAAKAECRGA